MTLTTHRAPSREAMAFALAQLVACRNYDAVKQDILRLVDTTHGGLLGELSSLNVLVEYGRDRGRHALDPVWEVVERKRRGGCTEQATTPRTHNSNAAPGNAAPGNAAPGNAALKTLRDRKTAYQAAYMAARRERLRKAIELYQRVHNVRLTTQERRDLQNSLQTTWMLWRNELLEGTPPGADRNEITQLFWSEIDDQLDLGLKGDVRIARQVLAEETEE